MLSAVVDVKAPYCCLLWSGVMDFSISGSNDWKDDEFSNALHDQLFRNTNMSLNSSISVDTSNTKKSKRKRKRHELTDYDAHANDARGLCLPVKENDGTEVTKLTIDGTSSPKKKSKKKKRKIETLSNSLAFQEKSVSNSDKQHSNKSKFFHYEQDTNHVRTEDRLAVGTKNQKFIISKESSGENNKVVPCVEQTISELPRTSKHKKRKRKYIEEPSDPTSNKRQKQDEEQSPVLVSKGKTFESAKPHLLSATKLQHIFRKYDTSTQEEVQKTDDQKSGSSILKEKAMKRLEAAKFRFLNEKMYTATGGEALEYFQNDPDAFEEYHSGYQSQVKKWSVNPVDLIITDLQKKPKSLVIADLGCGDAKIARVLSNRRVHSFDLVALNDKVVCCDISKVPLGDESVDISVFCLSLMGTNLADYILEAHRILKDGGLLKIAEVESRIKDLDEFITNVGKYGFSLVSKDTKHKMFVFMDFHKVTRKMKKSKLPPIEMDPCIYKKR